MAFENRPTDYALTPEGTLVHRRWLNADGSRKQGLELRKEKLRSDLERLAQELMALCRDIDAT